MKRIGGLILVLCVSLWIYPALAPANKKQEAAIAAAQQWLALIDAGNYAKSWQESAELFRNAISKGQWEQSLNAVRQPLGELISRKVKSAIYTTSLPGAPDGEYVVIQFETSFVNKQSAIETVTPMSEKSGGWRVSGYFIK
jgi:Fe2+ transport system protein B